ncbi:MAG: winged helix-turn-helix transcriptional regulator [Lachnospiraceae bacterium]
MSENFELEMEPCPVETTINLISNKWKVLIIRELLSGTKRFGELRRGIGEISQKVLTENLRSMESDGIVDRIEYDQTPPRVEYRLSELGDSMKPVIEALQNWGINYLSR